MLRRPLTRIELKPEDKEEVRAPNPPPPRATHPPPARPPRSLPRETIAEEARARSDRAPRSPGRTQYEEARKAHIRKLQADLARGTTDNLVQNSFQFNPDAKDDKGSKEERIGLNK